MNTEQGIKFLGADISNFKNIKKKQIDIGGRSFKVLGKNGAGKSSLINALLSPLNTKLRPSVPIMEGEERSEIEITLGNDSKKYILNLYFTPGNSAGRLTLKDETGADLKPPASILKSLIGDISFDLFKFLNDTKADKIKTLKRLTGKEKEIDLAAMDIAKLKEERKRLNQRIEDSQASMNNHGFSPEDIDKYSIPIPMEPIQKELESISISIDNWSKRESGIRDRKDMIAAIDASTNTRHANIKKWEEEITKLRANIELARIENEKGKEESSKLSEEIGKVQAWLDANEKPSAEKISKKLSDASTHNQNCSRVEEFAKKQRELIQSKQELQKKDIEIKGAEKKRAEIITSSKLPVEGLTFDDNEIYLNSLPLEEGQQNTATLMDVSSEICMALNPNLRTVFLHEGSLLDSDSLQKIIKKIERRGYQCIVEVVSSETEGLEIKFVEQEIN